MNDIEISITKDTATAAVERLIQSLGSDMAKVNDRVGYDMAEYVKGHFETLPPNKQGWPSQGFYAGAAAGTRYTTTQDGVRILVDNEDAPGAVKHAYNRGEAGKIYIYANGKLLTIPAGPQFYGERAGSFDNLRFVPFKSGAKALVVDTGGTGRVNFETGGYKTGSKYKGIGSRSVSQAAKKGKFIIAYWLKESVEQDARPGIIPSREALVEHADKYFRKAVDHLVGGQN